MKYVCEGCESEVARLYGGVCFDCIEAADWAEENIEEDDDCGSDCYSESDSDFYEDGERSKDWVSNIDEDDE
jgi:hypothetical protein